MPSAPLRRALLTGHDIAEIEPTVLRHGFQIVQNSPDLVICHGGDGTLIGAEREWPGVPKLAIRRSTTCKKCDEHQDDAVLAAVVEGRFTRSECMKIEAETKGQTLVGINDVIIHNALVTSAVRHLLWIDGEALTHEIVGDGLVVATPFGSTAYYRAITHSTFQVGLGLAFNNSREPIDHLVLRPEAEIRVRITRGPATLASDNNPAQIQIDRGDEVLIRRHPNPAVILMIGTLTCSNCERIVEADGFEGSVHLRPDHRGTMRRFLERG
jgi:NAD+ kinase